MGILCGELGQWRIDELGRGQTIINSIFVKVWVEGRVVNFRVGVAGVW